MTNECEVERLLFQQINKPKNYLMLKAINVFGEYYRVNVYTQTEEDGLLKRELAPIVISVNLRKIIYELFQIPKKTQASLDNCR